MVILNLSEDATSGLKGRGHKKTLSPISLTNNKNMSTNNEVKVKNLARKLGVALCNAGRNMIQSSFRLEPATVGRYFLSRKLELHEITVSESLSDQNYLTITWPQWQQILAVDWTEQKKYIKDVYDCDNFAFMFSSRMAETFGINTAGVAYGLMTYADGKQIGHAFNVIYSDGNFYVLEPQNDKWVKYVKGQPTVIEGREYKINWVIFY